MRAKISLILALLVSPLALGIGMTQAADSAAPKFVPDYSWPKPLPNHWQIGAADALFVDKADLIWTGTQSNILNSYDLALEKKLGDCCNMAPTVIAFNRAGDVVKSWDVSGPRAMGKGFTPLAGIHTIYVDYKNNVWVTGHGDGDSQVLKFDYNGKFLLQIGGSKAKGCCGNQDTVNTGGGTGVAVWPATNEVFVTDGYVNRRVIVFDADTGKFKRMWGAYGHAPPKSSLTTKKQGRGENAVEVGVMTSPEPERKFDGEGAKEWSTVHGVAITPDGVVWIADRVGNRIQQFKIDGTYIKEAFVNRKASAPTGTVYDFSFSPDNKWVYVPDGASKEVHILDRNTLKEVGTIGNHCGGQMPGCFNHVHVTGVDSAGNVYTGEAAAGARLQKWRLVK